MKLFFLPFLLLCSSMLSAQDDLDAMLEDEMSQTTDYVSATFKSTRVVNGHSIERMQEGQLEFRVSHRFDNVKTGWYDLFGMDNASTYLSLEYGVQDWLMVGVGRASIQKYFNSFAKFSLLRQTQSNEAMPLSLSYMISGAYKSVKLAEGDPFDSFQNRMIYTHQLLIARKFNSDFSLQLSPTMIHRNLVEPGRTNDVFALGIGTRYKLTNWVSINAEYFYNFNKDMKNGEKVKDCISLGFDIDTGGHVFQLHFTNSPSMLEHGFIGENTSDFFKGEVHFGFNISRVFAIY